jgi:hypothetical protein
MVNMKYRPTPRDLFNPPPQVNRTTVSFQERLDELAIQMWNLNPRGAFTKEQNLFSGILGLLYDHEERIR